MKIKNQNTLPSKYVLLILVIVCGILLGAERFMDGGGPLSWVANYTIEEGERAAAGESGSADNRQYETEPGAV